MDGIHSVHIPHSTNLSDHHCRGDWSEEKQQRRYRVYIYIAVCMHDYKLEIFSLQLQIKLPTMNGRCVLCPSEITSCSLLLCTLLYILVSRRQLTSSERHFSMLNLVIIQLQRFHSLLIRSYTAQPTAYITWLSLWRCFYWPFLNSLLCSQTNILIQLCSQKKIFIQPTSVIGYV